MFPILGGLLVDSFGVRTVLFICSIFIILGQTLFMLGVIYKSFTTALIGRFIFGCGGENLDLAQSIIVLRWFSGKELSMAFGLNSMTSLIGSVLNDNIEPIVVEAFGLGHGLMIGLIICVLSFICTILALNLDKKRDNSIKDLQTETFQLKDLSKFNFMFALLLINTICMDCSIYCFSYIASGFLQDRFGYSAVEAGSLMSISFFVSACFSPVFGILADKHGKRGLMMVLADLLVVFFHLFFILCNNQPGTFSIICAFSILGIGFAIYMTVFWTSLAYVVKKEIVGTAYGLSYAISNLALFICPVIVGYIQKETVRDKGYFWVSTFLAILAGLGTLSAYWVHRLDLKSGGVLHKAENLESKSY